MDTPVDAALWHVFVFPWDVLKKSDSSRLFYVEYATSYIPWLMSMALYGGIGLVIVMCQEAADKPGWQAMFI